MNVGDRVRYDKQTVDMWSGRPMGHDDVPGTIVEVRSRRLAVVKVKWDCGDLYTVSTFQLVKLQNEVKTDG